MNSQGLDKRICSLHGWEMSLETLRLSGLLLPASSDGLPLSVELNSALAIEVRGAPHAIFVTSEAEHGQGNRNRKVDTDLTSVDLSLELASGVAILGENSCTVAPSVSVG